MWGKIRSTGKMIKATKELVWYAMIFRLGLEGKDSR